VEGFAIDHAGMRFAVGPVVANLPFYGQEQIGGERAVCLYAETEIARIHYFGAHFSGGSRDVEQQNPHGFARSAGFLASLLAAFRHF
jgi:hypothetical protein